jgi:hypothetical protein
VTLVLLATGWGNVRGIGIRRVTWHHRVVALWTDGAGPAPSSSGRESRPGGPAGLPRAAAPRRGRLPSRGAARLARDDVDDRPARWGRWSGKPRTRGGGDAALARGRTCPPAGRAIARGARRGAAPPDGSGRHDDEVPHGTGSGHRARWCEGRSSRRHRRVRWSGGGGTAWSAGGTLACGTSATTPRSRLPSATPSLRSARPDPGASRSAWLAGALALRRRDRGPSLPSRTSPPSVACTTWTSGPIRWDARAPRCGASCEADSTLRPARCLPATCGSRPTWRSWLACVGRMRPSPWATPTSRASAACWRAGAVPTLEGARARHAGRGSPSAERGDAPATARSRPTGPAAAEQAHAAGNVNSTDSGRRRRCNSAAPPGTRWPRR